MLLLHEFYARKFLLPDKLSGRERERQARRQHASLHGDDGEEFEEVKAGAWQDAILTVIAIAVIITTVIDITGIIWYHYHYYCYH